MPLKVILTGTYRQPELRFPFGWGDIMPRGSVTAQEWVKKLGSRYFNREEKTWYITGVGTAKSPDRFFADLGLEVDFSEATGELAGLTSLNELWRPLVMRSQRFPHQAFVRPRLAGFADIQERLGPGAVWDKNLKRFEVLLSDLVTPGPDGLVLKRGFLLDSDGFEAAVRARRESSIPAAVREAARELGASTGVDGDVQDELSLRTRELIDIVASHTGRLPEWFGLALYPFQEAGAYAIVGGHNALCDAPGLGKCVVPETNVLANGAYTAIGQLWDEYAAMSAPRPDYDGVGEIIELSPGQLTVQALNDNVTTARTVSASHLYRERITAPVKTIRTASGARITATLPHKFLTSKGWASEIQVGDMIGAPEDEFSESPRTTWTKVTSVEISDYDGWVYDLTVPDGHNYIAEGLWSHNTRQALAAAAISGADRVVIVVPPLVVTNFSREATAALGPKFAMMPPPEPTPAPKTKSRAKKPKKAPEFPPYIVPIRAGRKVPPFPEAGVVVVADSLLASRPELLDDIVAWGPQCVLFDEAHRASTWSGKRATADRNLSLSANGLSVPMTGTPFKANPVEVTNILALSGHLGPVFGGASEFIERYATKDRHGGWMPKRKMLPDLERELTAHCWVRRNKQDVLKQLPPKLRTTRVVDIDRKGFAQAHEALYEKIGLWVDEMLENGVEITQEDIKVYAKTHIEIIAPLRAAAGVAKIPAAIEIVKDWLQATTETGHDGSKVYTRPLVVWVHHSPVMEALKAAIPADMAGIGFIDGSTPEHKRQPEADKLQNGEIGVIFCSIMAAGFGITLTRSSDVIFIETDWTPANISQAEDRVHRIGQTETCMITTLLAVDTLDAHMRAILRNKGKDLNVLMPGADNNVTVMTAHLNEEAGQYEILTQEDRELEKEFKSVPDIIERIVTEIVRQRTSMARAA